MLPTLLKSNPGSPALGAGLKGTPKRVVTHETIPDIGPLDLGQISGGDPDGSTTGTELGPRIGLEIEVPSWW